MNDWAIWYSPLTNSFAVSKVGETPKFTASACIEDLDAVCVYMFRAYDREVEGVYREWAGDGGLVFRRA